MLQPERDKTKIEAYKVFYKEHKELFRTNPVEYWEEARVYVERELRNPSKKSGWLECLI